MTAIDWLLLAAYLVLTLVLGLWLARRNSVEADYFVAGRRLNGWLAGASMAATTFSICLLYTSPSPRDKRQSRMPSSA